MKQILSATFSQLPNIAKANVDDLLLVAHKNDDGEYSSMTISIYDLAVQLNEQYDHYFEIKELKTMAFQMSTDYALSSHDHDCFTSATYQQNSTANAYKILTLSSLNSAGSLNSTMYLSVGAPDPSLMPEVPVDSHPKLGSIHLIEKPNGTLIDDEYALAGSTVNNIGNYLCCEQLKTMYSHTATSITLPSLKSYLKFSTNMDGKTTYHSGHTALFNHTHNLNDIEKMQINTKITDFEIIGSTEDDKTVLTCNHTSKVGHNRGTGAHYGLDSTAFKNPFSSYWRTPIIDNIFKNGAIATNEDGTDDVSYPKHNLISAYIYLGPKIS